MIEYVSSHICYLLAANVFDVMVTVDKRMANEQKLADLKIPVVIMACRSTQFKHVRHLVPKLLTLLRSVSKPDFYYIPVGLWFSRV